MNSRTLFERGSLAISLSDEALPSAVELLATTTWGTPGGTQYRKKDTRARIKNQSAPVFANLHKGDHLMGMVAFSRRSLPNSGTEGMYLRYLSMLGGFQRKVSAKTEVASRPDGLVKTYFKRMLSKPFDLNVVQGQGPEAAIYYAYVELHNKRSYDLCNAIGFSPIAKFGTTIFSRSRPKLNSKVHEAKVADQPMLLEHTRDFYSDHAFYTEANIFRDGSYYFYEEGGKPVAGLQVFPCHWMIDEMAGWSGKFLVKVLPHLPFVRQIYNPKAFRFLAVEGMWYEPGYEKCLFDIMEHALHANDRKIAMLWLDKKSPLQEVMKAGKLGLLNRFDADAEADIIVRGTGTAENSIEKMKTQPVYISSYDSV